MTKTSNLTIYRLQDAIKAVNEAIENMKVCKSGYICQTLSCIHTAVKELRAIRRIRPATELNCISGIDESLRTVIKIIENHSIISLSYHIKELQLQADNIQAILDKVGTKTLTGSHTPKK